MSDVSLYLSLLVGGLAGSLHCVGMCGPLLIGFSQAFGLKRGDFIWYHAGRIWTYGVMGFCVGLAGERLLAGAAILGWQRPIAVVAAVLVLLTGLLLTGLVRLPVPVAGDSGASCSVRWLSNRRWLVSMMQQAGPFPRLLLGAMMGLLPCGLVYGMLALAATTGSAASSALGMLLFGLGTVPSLSAVLWAGRRLPLWVRVHGTTIVAWMLILTGGLMLARALWISPEEPCPACTAQLLG